MLAVCAEQILARRKMQIICQYLLRRKAQIEQRCLAGLFLRILCLLPLSFGVLIKRIILDSIPLRHDFLYRNFWSYYETKRACEPAVRLFNYLNWRCCLWFRDVEMVGVPNEPPPSTVGAVQMADLQRILHGLGEVPVPQGSQSATLSSLSLAGGLKAEGIVSCRKCSQAELS